MILAAAPAADGLAVTYVLDYGQPFRALPDPDAEGHPGDCFSKGSPARGRTSFAPKWTPSSRSAWARERRRRTPSSSTKTAAFPPHRGSRTNASATRSWTCSATSSSPAAASPPAFSATSPATPRISGWQKARRGVPGGETVKRQTAFLTGLSRSGSKPMLWVYLR